MDRNAKIIATFGPSSKEEKTIEKLILAGVDIARLNFSHGTHQSHKELIDSIRKLSLKLKKPVTLLQDLQGPKLRVGLLPKEGVKLTAGETIFLELDKKSNKFHYQRVKPKIIHLDIPNIIHCLHKGSRILLDDGKIELEIDEIIENGLKTRVTIGGIVYSNKGVNLPGIILDMDGFTSKDKLDLEFGLHHGIDAVAISFVRRPEDIIKIRNYIFDKYPEKRFFPIIAKIELPEAIKNLASILDAADGVMVARGDLAVETSPSEVPIIQKQIIQSANRKARLVITATQMLDSMVDNPRPTRAEASDVANAIFDGTDAVMLSGETANGKYPVESVMMMDSIIREAEKNIMHWGHPYQTNIEIQDDAFAISMAARELAHNRNVTYVAVFTQSGKTAILQSKARPQVPILAFTPNEHTFRTLGLFWGVIPYLVPFSESLEDMIRNVEQVLIQKNSLVEGQKIVLVCGFPVGAMRSTNLAILHTIGTLYK